MLTVLLFIAFLALYLFVLYQRADKVRVKNTLFLLLGWAGFLLLARLALFTAYGEVFRETSFPLACWTGLRFDLAVFAYAAGPFFILLQLPFASVRWQKTILGLAAAVLFACLVATAGDIFYFGYVHRHTGEDIFNLFTSFSLIWQVIWHQYRLFLVLLTGIGAGLVWLACYLAGRTGTPKRGKALWEILALAMSGWFCFLFAHGLFLWQVEFISPSQAYVENLRQGQLAENGLYSMLYALGATVRPQRSRISYDHAALRWQTPQEAKERAASLYASAQENTPDKDNPFLRQRIHFNADAQGKNLILLALESWDYYQTDALAGTNYGLTPNIDALIKEGLVFDRFYSCTQDSSLVGIGGIMSGTCKVGGLPYFSRGLETRPFTGIGALFRRQGYKTVFVRALEDKTMYIGPLARLMGFDTFEQKNTVPLLSYPRGTRVSDYEGLMLLAEEFKKSDKPFFGFFFSISTHEPVGQLVPLAFEGENGRTFQADSYQRALFYTDWAIGKFIEKLKEYELYENTVFVLVADHRLRAKRFDRQEDTFHVPFIISAPGILPAGRSAKTCGQPDILPTLVDMFRLKEPYFSMGKSLLDENIKEFSFVSNNQHFGLAVPEGMVFENETPGSKNDSVRQNAVAINRAVYDVLK